MNSFVISKSHSAMNIVFNILNGNLINFHKLREYNGDSTNYVEKSKNLIASTNYENKSYIYSNDLKLFNFRPLQPDINLK